MGAITNYLPEVNAEPVTYVDRSHMKVVILVAVAAIMALGMVLSYLMGAPWLFPLLFFALGLTPLFPLGSKPDTQIEKLN